MMSLCSYLRSRDGYFFAMQNQHLKEPEGRQACSHHFEKYGDKFDAPLHPDGRGGVTVAWKSSGWMLQSTPLLSSREVKAMFTYGPLGITLALGHWHHKHSKRHQH